MIGKKPIKLPEGVNISIADQVVEVSGPLGRLSVNLPLGVKVSAEEQEVRFSSDSAVPSRIFGLGFALVRNAIEGVSQGFSKELELVGVGYRAEKTAPGLKLTLGFSHPVEFPVPAGVAVEVADSTKLKFSGIDRGLVTQVAAQLRKLRPPEPYKGKGIRYANEVVRRKQGKVVKAAGGTA
ncbi:50S ribosomal protein L6 [candidate division WWE3 bacterium RIFCSPLOWO2_01_FULL_53_14]|uniref:50S ribosomal protein L6 n=1 Tax=candidate division WWE3 bacterium RIFCSPLOWO2_01_FULL_53_14 TaxID=1802628 RepID=A0A1F4VS43_UNCKA|nr:MAG: 50S ribosomal protein L6 [candidate division WWE3 bacterium RIFCSPLOWO2_01_FULL_53_14]